ncbi:MAG: cysteine desulfurase family protein, partial [Oscillospiraceae bacterium]
MPIIYLDNASTTRVDSDVIDVIADTMLNNYGNPSSLHIMGVNAQRAFEASGEKVLKAIRAKSGRVIFTSGGTESNNLAILGAAHALQKRGKRIITTAVEHSSVLAPFKQLESEGFEVIYVSCDKYCRVNTEELEGYLTPDTILVSCMAVNNEIGTVEPIADLAAAVRRLSPNALFHCDAIQAVGKIPIDVRELDVDLLSMSGHKINCSKGIGALYIKGNTHITPIIYGGGQQGGLKSGTENVPLAVGFAKALETATAGLNANAENAQKLKAYAFEELKGLEEFKLLSPLEGCSPFIFSFALLGFMA